jgi:hypothetical protein
MNARKDYGCPLRIYDSGDSRDRYTILPPRSARSAARYQHGTYWDSIWADNGMPLTRATSHATGNGDRITWSALPPAVQQALRASFLAEYCPKEGA